MNRYPVWKYLLMVVAVLVGLLYTVPNLYGEAPAVQVSAAKLTTKIGAETVTQVEQLLAAASIKADYVAFEGTSVKARFRSAGNITSFTSIARTLMPILAASGCTRARSCAPISSR